MKTQTYHALASGVALLLCLAQTIALPRSAGAQQVYHNLINQHFRTIGNGPQSVIIVDVDDPNDAAGVRRAVDARVSAVMRARAPGLQREVMEMRQRHLLKPGQRIPIVDTVFIRHNGRLVTVPPRATRQAPATNSITYVAATTGQYAYGTPDAAALDAVVNNTLYPELVRLLGPPLWNGQVTINNKDDNPTLVSGIIGVVVVNNGGAISLDLPTFTKSQDKYLGLLQAMAQTFHGPLAIGYDAWETGMARAAAVVAANDLQSFFASNLASDDQVDPASDFYYTANYDVLNQPALSNNTFLPPTASGQPIGAADTGIGGMLLPRLQTSSTAWLKCYIEGLNNGSGPNFFHNFNNAYYDAYQNDPTVANNVTSLRQFAASAIGGSGSVEGQPFDQWFEQQYVFDTSITTGNKVYVYALPSLPDSTHPNEDGANIYLLYYQTTATGDEIALSGSYIPVYYDYTFSTRLTLSQDSAVTITNGEGDTAPLFTGIGSPAQTLLAMDFPVGGSYQRIYFPANVDTNAQTGAPSDFFGVVAGSSTTANADGTVGNLTATFTGGNGTVIATSVIQGAFGATGGAAIPNNFTQATLTYTPNSSNQAIVYKRNVYQRADMSASGGFYNVSSTFVLTAPTPTETLNHTFLGGADTAYMISLPIQPLNADLAAIFGTSPQATLLAQYDQSASGDHYQRYPNITLYRPGYGLWSGFVGALNGTPPGSGVPITGAPTDNTPLITVGLQYGWNQIGNPFNTNVTLTSDGTSGTSGGIQVQYLGGDAVDLATAVTNGWIASGVFGWDATNQVYDDITASSTQTTFQMNTLQPWNGYWILVTVPEGVALTYVNPDPNTRAAHNVRRAAPTSASKNRSRAPERGGWRLPLAVQDDQHHSATAVLGQSPHGANQFVAALDTVSPPAFTRSSGLKVRFPHSDWSIGPQAGGDLLTDIRRSDSSSTWNVTIDTPLPGHAYTLAWSGTARLPRGMSLTLVDLTNNNRSLMNGGVSYTFTPGTDETSRQFQIVAEPRSLTFVTIANLRVNASPTFGGRAVRTATIAYEMNAAADTSVQIRGGTGGVVRHLVQGRASTAGSNQMVWDLRDDRGRELSTGLYQIEVAARTSDGRQSKEVVPFEIIR